MKRHIQNVLAALGLIGVYLVWASDFAYGYASGGFFGLVQLGSVLAFLVASIARSKTHSGIFFVAALLSIPIHSFIHQSKKARSIESGEQILAALEQYKIRIGTYPGNLTNLVSTDLPLVPNTSMGITETTGFMYGTDVARANFRLAFKCPFFLETSYSSRRKKWITDD